MNYKLIIALCTTVIQADFKSVKTKFLEQGAEEEVIQKALEDFKKLRDQNKIQKPEDKDINAWGKKSWEEFIDFIDWAKEQITQTQQRKIAKKGATKVAENEHWHVYRINTHEAAKHYGAGTKWCVTQESPEHWENETRQANLYYYISKVRPKEDRYYKIAVQVGLDANDLTYWDALDNEDDDGGSGRRKYEDFPIGSEYEWGDSKFEKYKDKIPRVEYEPKELMILVDEGRSS